MFKRQFRRLLERNGHELNPLGTATELANLAEVRRSLEGEVDRLQRVERVLSQDLALERQTAADERHKLTGELAALQAAYDQQTMARGACEADLAVHSLMSPTVSDGDAVGQRETLDARLIGRLQAAGIPVATAEPVYLHVGFGHAATTSLQEAFFSQRPDLFYLGTPYRDAGGLFSYLKFLDSQALDEGQMLAWCRALAYGDSRRDGRPIVVSDETFCDTSEVYYCPRHLPGDIVAARLKRFFPTAKILFTIRHQPDYVASMYFNLKRNYAFLAGERIPEFQEWWEGLQTQVRCLYLQNLDYAPLIDVYARLFGRDNLLVLPLEELKHQGTRAYLEIICRFLGVELREDDVAAFSTPRNERMSVVEGRLAELLAAGSPHWTPVIRDALDKRSLANLMAAAPRLALQLSEDQLAIIRQRVAAGNRRLAAEYKLRLGDLGYFV
ncbi:MAG: hypothetical protein ACKV0T_21865 [Planctomycetales bacterium]